VPTLGEQARKEATDDFAAIWQHYSPHAWLRGAEGSRPDLQFAHRYAFAIAAVARSLPPSPEHARIFALELASDAVHFIHSVMCGDGRGARFYLRSAIENVWRHIYFRDHAVEYSWLTSKPKYYASLEFLKDYCRQLDDLNGLSSALNGLARGYADLSRIVHSSSPPTLVLRETLEEIGLTRVECRETVDLLKGAGRDLLLILLVLHSSDVRSLPPALQRYAIDVLDVARKRIRQRLV
jgi:hypothetical protein